MKYKLRNKILLTVMIAAFINSNALFAQQNQVSDESNKDTTTTESAVTNNNEPKIDENKDEKLTEEAQKISKELSENKKLSGHAVIVDLASDKLEYFQENDTFVATGAAKVFVSEQNAELIADKIIYHQGEQYLTAEGNVKINKKGKAIEGGFARIDLEKESALITNPNAIINKVRMNAKEAVLYPDYIELKDGSAIIDQEKIDLKLSSSEYKPAELKPAIPGHESIMPKDPANKKPSYKIIAKEIELDRAKKTNNLILKNAKVYIGKVKVATIPRLTLTIGDTANSIEAMLPEVGFNKNIGGIYLGPSLTLDLPKNSTLRVSPVFSAAGSEHTVGGGIIGHFNSPINKTDIAYTTTGDRLVVKGEQKIYGETTKIRYYVNEYPTDDFMGMGLYRPLYLAELIDERKIGKLLNHNIFSKASAGVARDVNDGIATARFRLQGNIVSDKPILHYKDYVAFRLQSQFNLAAYGTGDGYAIIRGGPRIDWNLWRLGLTTTYMQAGVWGETPFIFDEFIRGKSNLIIAGDFKLSRYLSVGNIRSLNLGKDGPDPNFTTENQFYARFGPEDFKFRVGYDLERKRSTFGLDLFLGSGRSQLGFDKMKILNPEVDIR